MMGRLLIVQMNDGSAKFCNRLIGGVDDIAHAGNLKRRLLVDNQTGGVIILRAVDDSDLHTRGVDHQITFLQR